MTTEKQKMLSGELYHAADPELINERSAARIFRRRLSEAGEDKMEQRTGRKELPAWNSQNRSASDQMAGLAAEPLSGRASASETAALSAPAAW